MKNSLKFWVTFLQGKKSSKKTKNVFGFFCISGIRLNFDEGVKLSTHYLIFIIHILGK